MTKPAPLGWQLLLADLSLILFLTTASALSDTHERAAGVIGARPGDMNERGWQPASYVSIAGAPPFADWLTDYPRDPREQLTIRAQYIPARQKEALAQLQALSGEAATAGFSPRVIAEPGSKMRISASFGFDAGDDNAAEVARLLLNTQAQPGEPPPATGE